MKEYFKAHREEILEDWKTFLRFPSISSDPDHIEDGKACALWLKSYLEKMGLQTETWETEHLPILFASYKTDKEKPTILIYLHYDVQPVDPIELWDSPPFEPTIRNGELFARGAQDNKGQCFYTITALKALLETTGELPVNVKLIIDGEEEIGSPSLSALLPQKKEQLKAESIAIIDVGIPSLDTPAVTIGVRGIVTFDLVLTGSNTDLHSGSNGGVVLNPNQALVQLLSTLHDPKTGAVTVEGFYDDVISLSDEERNKLFLQFNEEEYKKTFDANPVGGEKGFTPLERAWIRPTLEINGMGGGCSREGFKTVIPASSYAKLSCRLVAHQDPQKIEEAVVKHLKKHCPEGVQIDVSALPGGGGAVRANPDSPIVKAFSSAYEKIFGTKCNYIFEGGSIPIIPELAKAAEGEVVLVGLGLADDQIHAPNEHFGLSRFEKGAKLVANALQELK